MEKNKSKKNVVDSSKNSTNIDPKELEKFSQEITKKLHKLSKNPSTKKRRIFGGLNPIVLMVTVVVISFLVINMVTSQSFLQKTSLDEVMTGLRNGEYSELNIQDDGKIVVVDKKYAVLESELSEGLLKDSNLKVSSLEKDNFEKIKTEDLGNMISQDNIAERLRGLLNGNSSEFDTVLVLEDSVIVKSSSKIYIIEDTNYQEFISELEDFNINLEEKGVKIEKLEQYGEFISAKSFSNRVEADQFLHIYDLGGFIIAEKSSEFVDSSYIDWTASIYSFTDVLQQEGISLSESDIKISTTNVPAGITLDDILTILMLVGFVIIGVMIFRSAQSSGMGLMQFGQSKAKMFFGQKIDTNFDNVAGIDEAREELNEIVSFLKTPNKFRKLGARIPKGILMFGAPGTGKTLLARAIAGEAGVPFFHTSGSEFEEMLVGAGASRVRDLFAKAKKAAPSLIFIDEIDAVARKRGTRIQSGSTEQTLNQILVEMDGFEKNTNVIVIAATNRPDVLDPAILRPGRFDRQVRIELPDVSGREQILKIHGKNKPFGKDVNLEKVAKRTVGFTGADLENILNEAAIIAAKANQTEIFMADIDEAVSKVVLGPAKKSRKRSEDEIKLVAYHEAGHAIVAKNTAKATPVDKISIISRGGTGGVTMFLPEKDENIVSKVKLIADITVSMGGRAAEEIQFEDISTGASGDIKQATKVAKRMIQQFGMSSSLGLVEYGDHQESGLGYQYGDVKDYSEKTAELIDNEVREIISGCYSNALDILKKNKDKLDKLANLLIEKEVIDKEEFERLMTS